MLVGSGVMTSLSVGSLLDDNIWHDVVISRNRRDIVFSVDRVMIQGKIKGEFSRLNLNRAVSNDLIFMYSTYYINNLSQLYIGGVPNKQEGIVITQNFTGCIENMYLNSTNLIRDIKDAYLEGQSLRYEKVNTLYTCPVSMICLLY